MGARQSVAQPPRQRQTPAASADLGMGPSSSGNSNGGSSTNSTSAHFTNGHTLGEPSTSTDGGNRNRSSLIFQSSLSTTATASSSQQAPRPRQTRSRSVPMPPPDVVRGTNAAASSTNQTGQQYHHPQLRHQYRPHHYPIVARDQSSDSSGGDNDGGSVTTGIPSLDRLLRLNSAVAAGGHASGSGTGANATAVWLPPFAFRHYDVKCPVCSKMIPSDDVEYHLVVCLTRPRIAYNEDVLTEDKGECVICFEEMLQGDTIARLPCLCVYHKMCIDSWFKVKNSCPEHPGDDD